METILTFGDSNSYGTKPMAHLDDDARFDHETRWPCVMRNRLGKDVHLVEEGHPGRTTVHDDPIEGIHRNGARIIEAVIESHRPIDLMIILLGTNDQKYRFSLGAIDIAHGVGRLVEIARASGHVKEILVVAPPAVVETGCLAAIFAGAEVKSARLAEEIEIVAQSRGVHFFDAGEIIKTDPLDGVHFSAESHIALGNALANFIKETIK